MTVIVTDLGEVAMLRWCLRGVPAGDDPLHIHLFTNDYHPDRESDISAFVQATFSGYAPQNLDRASWAAPASVGGVAYTTYGTDFLSWFAGSGTQTVWGFYVTDAADSVCYWAARFDDPVEVSPTVPVRFQPFMRLHSEAEPAPPP